MTTRFTVAALLLLALALPVVSSAQTGKKASTPATAAEKPSTASGIRIGYASPERIVDQLPEFKKIQDDLQKMVQAKEAGIIAKRDSLAATFQKYQQNAATMSAAQNEAEQSKLQAKNDELQELSNTIRIEVQRKQAELLQPLYAKVQEAITAVAKENKLDFVFNRTTAQGDSIILFVLETEKDKLDITDKVIAKLTKK